MNPLLSMLLGFVAGLAGLVVGFWLSGRIFHRRHSADCGEAGEIR